METESIDLETLTENTVGATSGDVEYALPWDFVVDAQQSSSEQRDVPSETVIARLGNIPRNAQESRDATHGLLILPNEARKPSERIISMGLTTTPAETSNEHQALSKSSTCKTPVSKMLRVQSMKKAYGCNICEETFRHKAQLNSHMKVHNATTVELYECDNCKEKFWEKTKIRQHIALSECNKSYKFEMTFTQSGNLSRHRNHSTDMELFEYDASNVTFERWKILSNHKRNEHKTEIASEHNNLTTVEKPFECSICNLRFAHSCHLFRHMRNKHDTVRQPFKCQICDKSFLHKSSLERHMITHTDEKRYTCDICHLSFTQRGNLYRHQAIHNAKKVYSCDICGKKFILKSYLYTHIRIHNWEKYDCSFCKKYYRRKSSLKRHELLSHMTQALHECGMCPKFYKRGTNLQIHLKRVHNVIAPL